MSELEIKMYRIRVAELTTGIALYLALAIAGFALRRPEYSHLRNTISELGEYGARDSLLAGWGVFFPVGLALAALAGLFWKVRVRFRAARPAAALAACVAVGYLVAVFFPCDPGSPFSGSGRQAIHNIGGAVEYFGGAVALVFLARASAQFRWVFTISAIVTLAVAFGISVPELTEVRGLLQRVGEASLFGSLIVATRLART